MSKKSEVIPTIRAKLSAIPKKRLVSILEELAVTVEGVASRVELLVAERDADQAIDTVLKQITALKRSQRKYRGFEGADELADQVLAMVDLVQRSVLPTCGYEAVGLAAMLVELDGTIFEMADDSYGHLGAASRKACALFGVAIKACPRSSVLPLVLGLWVDDRYGARGTLLGQVVPNLDSDGRAEFIAFFRARIEGAGVSPVRKDQIALMDIADALGDPELYEEACMAGDGRQHAVFRLHVAQRYLRAGRALEALERMPAQASECGGYAHEWESTRIAILGALGRSEELLEALWLQFQKRPDNAGLAAWLSAAPESARPAMRAQARTEALQPGHAPWIQARFFVDLDEKDTAAACILARPAQLDGSHYYELVPLAETLAASHPLAATVLYRSLLEANLSKALAKYYAHGVRYWHALAALEPQIPRWAPLSTHPEYCAELRSKHVRKTSFWARLSE